MTTITIRQAQKLLDFFGGHDTEVTIAENLEGQPPGLYAWCTECPDEGSEYLGPTEVDDELARNGTNWAEDLGRLDQGDIELMEDAIEALLQPMNQLAREHAVDGLRKRVAAAWEILRANQAPAVDHRGGRAGGRVRARADRLPQVRHHRPPVPARHQGDHLLGHALPGLSRPPEGQGAALQVPELRGDLPATAGGRPGRPAHDGAHWMPLPKPPARNGQAGELAPDKKDSTPVAQVVEPLTQPDVVSEYVAINGPGVMSRDHEFARAIQRACARKWGLTLKEGT